MTERAQWPYWMATAILIAALTVFLWPAAEPVAAARAPGVTRGLAVKAPDSATLEAIAAEAERLPFRGQTVAIEGAAQDRPPAVIGVVRIGRRGFAYVDGGERSGRLAVGQASGGWTLTEVGANWADFSRGGETQRVRLFSRPAPQAQAGTTPAQSVEPVPAGAPEAVLNDPGA